MFDTYSNKVGHATLKIGFDYLNKVMTNRSIEETSLSPEQYIQVVSVESDNDEKVLIIECNIYEHRLN